MSRVFDRLPLEVALALTDLVAWREEVLAGRSECASAQLLALAESTDKLIEWRKRTHSGDRLSSTVFEDTATHRLAKDLGRYNQEPRPRLRVVPREPRDPEE